MFSHPIRVTASPATVAGSVPACLAAHRMATAFWILGLAPRTIAERLGAVTPADIEAMKRGRCPTVRTGPYTGDIVSVDHIIPRAVVPELDNVIANLEFMPLKMNQSKNDKIGGRQVSLAKAFRDAGLLGEAGFRRVNVALQK